MSVLIKGMEMPKSCEDCYIANCPNDIGYTDMGKCSRHINCPIIEVPEPHGDLIERNALFKKCEFVCTDDDEDIRAVRYSIIENAPIIIPASEE